MKIGMLFSSLMLCGSIAGCTEPQASDDSLYLTGTEQAARTLADGTKVCDGKKQLVCHIPPGNPANAHTICVGQSAVEPHQTQHGDTLGACAIEPTPPPTEPPPTDDDGGDDGSGSGGGGGDSTGIL